MEIFEYLAEQRFDFEKIDSNLFSIEGVKYLYVESKGGVILTGDFSLTISGLEESMEKDYYVFRLGSNFFYSRDASPVTLNPFKWVGKVKNSGIELPPLAVRGGYEILNGSGVYKNWAKKAKFLGCSHLGICEKNTLAGTLVFQLECASAGIHAVIGETVTVRSRKDFQYDIKLYPKNKDGWRILLLINKEINAVNHGFIWEDTLIELFNEEELSLVLDPKSMKYEDFFLLDLHLECKKYYQLDTVEYVADERDKEYLLNLSKFVNSNLEPIAILDSFYIDKEDFHAKKILNSIASTFEHESHNQYLKDLDDYYAELAVIFKDPEPIFTKAYQNLFQLISDSKFVIETKNRHLPEYRLTEEELAKYGDRDTLLWGLIQQGVEKKLGGNLTEEYAARIQEELEVIVNGGVVDYFLILHDIISWCRRNDILVGIARGSAGGSLIAFLLEITQINPIQYGLLFSRFLNAGRIFKKEKKEFVLLKGSKGEGKRLGAEEIVTVLRNEVEISVCVGEISEGDFLIQT